jgi:hypothetical protein
MTIDGPAWESLLELDEAGEILWCGGDWEPAHWVLDWRVSAWREAKARADAAYARWCSTPGPDAYAAYRALQDQADAAQDGLEPRPPLRPTGRRWGSGRPRGTGGAGEESQARAARRPRGPAYFSWWLSRPDLDGPRRRRRA